MKKSSCNGRSIYENCESNDRIISAMSRQELEQLLSKVQEEVQAQNKNVVFVDCSSGIIYEATNHHRQGTKQICPVRL